MIIESAERFGLSQLHQFRGRVNRADHQSYCLLFAGNLSDKADKRLKILTNCYDGFKLAEEDLKQRGFGSLIGSQQSGWFSGLKIASLADVELIEETKTAAKELAEQYPKIFTQLEIDKHFHPE